MAAGDTSSRSLENTPTWAFAVVCFFFISVSIIIEHSIHLLSNCLKRHRKTALSDAVEKLKSELMLMGFISLLLAVTQRHIPKICVSAKVGNIMLPCRKPAESQTKQVQDYEHFASKIIGKFSAIGGDLYADVFRRLAEDDETSKADAAVYDSCAEGKVALMSKDGIHQLHIFIFVLAVMHIVYSVLTMALGRAKMRRWKAWERETQTTEYQVANDPNRFRLPRQTTFGRRHTNSCAETAVHLWIKCFFRQFLNSVAKVDYLTLRHGFISAHLSDRHNTFNFQKYIQRSLDEDFRVVVGVSAPMWFFVVIFLLVDVYGWHVYLWVSYVPLLVVLVLGTKLEVIVARMALQIQNMNIVIMGTPLVQPNDNLFWFGHPRFVLTLIHYILFVNAFELAFFIWVTIQFGVNSCYHEHTVIIVTRVLLAVTVQVLCSYSTLPLYALVTQMGSQFKSNVLDEQMGTIIKQWHAAVRERRKKKQKQSLDYSQSPRTSLSTDWSPRRSSAATESPSFRRPTSYANRGEITEEKVGKDEAAGSSRAPSHAVVLELPKVARR